MAKATALARATHYSNCPDLAPSKYPGGCRCIVLPGTACRLAAATPEETLAQDVKIVLGKSFNNDWQGLDQLTGIMWAPLPPTMLQNCMPDGGCFARQGRMTAGRPKSGRARQRSTHHGGPRVLPQCRIAHRRAVGPGVAETGWLFRRTGPLPGTEHSRRHELVSPHQQRHGPRLFVRPDFVWRQALRRICSIAWRRVAAAATESIEAILGKMHGSGSRPQTRLDHSAPRATVPIFLWDFSHPPRDQLFTTGKHLSAWCRAPNGIRRTRCKRESPSDPATSSCQGGPSRCSPAVRHRRSKPLSSARTAYTPAVKTCWACCVLRDSMSSLQRCGPVYTESINNWYGVTSAKTHPVMLRQSLRLDGKQIQDTYELRLDDTLPKRDPRDRDPGVNGCK